MEVRELTSISEDLNSSDEDKCISALQQVIKRVNRSDDISVCWSGIFSNFSTQKSRAIRLLVYYILQTNSDISQSYWESLFPTILEDMNGSDQAIQIEAFRLLPHLPEPLLTKSIEDDVITPAMFQTQETSLTFRQCAIETLSALLLYSSQIFKITKFREFGWSFIAQKAFDPCPAIIYSAFSSINILFMYQEASYYPSRTEYQKDWDHINPTKRDLFKKTADLLAKQLNSRYVELLEKVLTIEPTLRWATIFPISYLSTKNYSQNELTSNLSTLRSRMTNLMNRLKPMLYATDEALVYEAGIAILYLNKKLGYIPGIVDTVVTSFCSMINNKQSPVTILQLYNAIFSSITKLIPSRIFEVISIILSNGYLITDLTERVTVIVKCWKFWIENSFKHNKHSISSFFSQKWVSDMFNSPKHTTYRKELIILLILSTKEYYLNSSYLKTISNILLASKFFMGWPDVDEYIFDLYLLIFDHVYYHKAENSNETMKFISDNISTFRVIPSRYVKLLFLLSKHPSACFSDIPSIISNGLFSSGNMPQGSKEEIIMIPNKANEGKLGSTILSRELPSCQIINLVLRTLQNVYLRGSEKDKQAVKDLMEEIIQMLHLHPLLQKRFQSSLKLLLANSFKPIYEQILLSSPIAAIPYFIISKELQSKQNNTPIVEEPSSKEISANSSPIAIHSSHSLNPLLNRLSLHFKIFNRTDIPLSSIRLVLCVNGNVKSEINAPQIYKYIPLLEYRSTVEWDVNLLITSFSAISFRLQISFLRLEDNGYNYPISKFNSMVYSIPLTELLAPIDITKEEFYQLWNSFPVGFHAHITSKSSTAEELLGYFLDGPFSIVDQPQDISSEFIQATFASITKFYELFCFTISGKYCDSKWVCRIEFRGSSVVSLNVLQSNFESWISKISQQNIKLLNLYADDNVFTKV